MTDWRRWRHSQRKRLIQDRYKLNKTQRKIFEQSLLTQLSNLFLQRPPGIIGFYWPIYGEIDCQPLILKLIAAGWQAALPKITAKQAPLEFRQWTPECDLQPEIWQIPVPQNTPLKHPDVLLIPLVGFNRQLHRLGNGGGFYDISLAAFKPRPFAIGIGFEMMRLEEFTAQSHDIAMDLIVTEKTVY